jgi:hypothetical protein
MGWKIDPGMINRHGSLRRIVDRQSSKRMELLHARQSSVIKFDSFEKQQIPGHKGCLQQRLKRRFIDPYYAVHSRIVRCRIGISDDRLAAIIGFRTLHRNNVAKYSLERFRRAHRLTPMFSFCSMIPHRQMGVKEHFGAGLLTTLPQRIHSHRRPVRAHHKDRK